MKHTRAYAHMCVRVCVRFMFVCICVCLGDKAEGVVLLLCFSFYGLLKSMSFRCVLRRCPAVTRPAGDTDYL